MSAGTLPAATSENSMKKTLHFHKESLITRQDVIHVLILLALSLLFSFVPTLGFGQTLPGNINDRFPASAAMPPADFSSLPAAASAIPEPAQATSFPDFFSPAEQSFASLDTSAPAPAPATAVANPIAAAQYQSSVPSQSFPKQTQQQQQQPQTQRALQHQTPIPTVAASSVAATSVSASAVSTSSVPSEHPFLAYWGIPKEPQTKITGKPMSVVELLSGTRSQSVRCQLLQAYWELCGLLAVYHFRCETERLAGGSGGAQQEGMMALISEQRRTAEVEFIKQQWVVAELLKQHKGRMLRGSELPIPADFPLYPHYQTHAEKIARTERSQYIGRMIPIQEQLIESKNGTWKAASAMALGGTQPFLTVANQRTLAFLELTKAIVEYNKMIAEYATETMPPNVGQQQFVAAVVRLPKRVTAPEQRQTPQMAKQGVALMSYNDSYDEVVPVSVPAQPVEFIASEFQQTAAILLPPYEEKNETEIVGTLPEPSRLMFTPEQK